MTAMRRFDARRAETQLSARPVVSYFAHASPSSVTARDSYICESFAVSVATNFH